MSGGLTAALGLGWAFPHRERAGSCRTPSQLIRDLSCELTSPRHLRKEQEVAVAEESVARAKIGNDRPVAVIIVGYTNKARGHCRVARSR